MDSPQRPVISWNPSGGILVATVVLLSVALSLLVARHIALPLDGDQALYLYGAARLSEGAALYKDFWDIKAPGVYLFYLVAGSSFGFSATGLHLLEGLWLAAAACLAYAICRTATASSRISHLAPFATVGTYFVAATPWHLSQPDGLVALPIVFGAWALMPRGEGSILTLRALFIAGLAAAGAAIFVTSMALVVFGFVVVVTAFEWFCGHTPTARRVTLRILAFCMGTALLFGCVLAWLYARGALQESIWTIMAYPAIAQSEFPRDPSRLISSVKWFIGCSACWLPAALAGAYATLRQAFRRERRAAAGLMMMVWLASGAVGLLMQYHYSWQFHFNQFFVPVGVLAIIGLAYVAGELRTGAPRLVSGVVMVTAMIFSVLVAAKVATVDDSVRSQTPFEESAREGLAQFRPGDSVYVFGDPRILLATGHEQAIPQNGWVLEVLVQAQWPKFAAAMRERAPTFIYITSTKRQLLNEKAPDLLTWIDAHYGTVAVDSFRGTWLRRRPD